ncbi:sorting nexin-29 [Culicoides brevitarsis]|uniref:sorting nexin-29 n=1 Tax=Culicoides brevitarsis TaxID=469753 RepID=UPI00307C6D7C
MSFINVNNILNRNYDTERSQITKDLVSIVNECKEKYSRLRTELATENDSKIMRLLDCWELLLFHGLKTNIFKPTHGFWDIAYEHLTRHEKERFDGLRHVNSDRGKCRALIRAALNERSLERYVLMWINDPTIFDKYEPYACILHKQTIDELPRLANALNDILFALTVDSPEVNDRKIHALEREEPIIPVTEPNNLEVHKRVPKVKRKVIDFEEKVPTAKEKEVILRPNRTPSPSVIPPIEENGHVEVNRGFIEEQLMFACDRSQGRSSIGSLMNESICSLDDRERKNSIIKSKENIAIVITEETGIEVGEDSILSSKGSSINSESDDYSPNFNETIDIEELKQKLKEKEERVAVLESQVAELSLENCRLRMLSSSASRNSKMFFNVSIPRAFLEAVVPTMKKYYIYEIHVTPSNEIGEEWIVKRRYSEFYELHKQQSINNLTVKTLDFPPKKKFGNMDANFVEQRRQRLQVYLKHLITILPDVAECCTKTELTRTFPFLEPDIKFS